MSCKLIDSTVYTYVPDIFVWSGCPTSTLSRPVRCFAKLSIGEVMQFTILISCLISLVLSV